MPGPRFWTGGVTAAPQAGTGVRSDPRFRNKNEKEIKAGPGVAGHGGSSQHILHLHEPQGAPAATVIAGGSRACLGHRSGESKPGAAPAQGQGRSQTPRWLRENPQAREHRALRNPAAFLPSCQALLHKR